MIRPLKHDDIDGLIPLLYLFQQETTYRDELPTSREELADILAMMVGHTSYGCFVAVEADCLVGFCMGAMVKASPFLPHVKLASEFAWWVRAESRGTTLGAKLLATFRRWGKDHGGAVLSFGRPLTTRKVKPGTYREEITRIRIGDVHHV